MLLHLEVDDSDGGKDDRVAKYWDAGSKGCKSEIFWQPLQRERKSVQISLVLAQLHLWAEFLAKTGSMYAQTKGILNVFVYSSSQKEADGL